MGQYRGVLAKYEPSLRLRNPLQPILNRTGQAQRNIKPFYSSTKQYFPRDLSRPFPNLFEVGARLPITARHYCGLILRMDKNYFPPSSTWFIPAFVFIYGVASIPTGEGSCPSTRTKAVLLIPGCLVLRVPLLGGCLMEIDQEKSRLGVPR